jgi:hypothetical protein
VPRTGAGWVRGRRRLRVVTSGAAPITSASGGLLVVENAEPGTTSVIQMENRALAARDSAAGGRSS